MSKLLFKREYENGETSITFWCPGCDGGHTIFVGGAETWTWNGDDEKPTFNPSVLANGTPSAGSDEWNAKHPRCHSFVRDGMIQYLSDSNHALAGLTVPMEKLPKRYEKFLRD